MTACPVYPAHTVPCPWCHAPAGTRCTTPRGRKLAVPSHDARIEAYAQQTTRTPAHTTPQPAHTQEHP